MITPLLKKQKTNVLILSLVYYPQFVGGAEIAVKEVTDRISREEVEFHMVTLHAPASLSTSERVGNVEVYRVLPQAPLPLAKLLFPFAACLKAWRLHRKNHYDLAWAIMANYAGFAALFLKYIFPRVKFLLTLQEGDPIPYIKKRVRFIYPLFRKIFTKADSIQAISNYLADWAKEMGARCFVVVIPNGVDVKKFMNEESGIVSYELKNKLGINDWDKVLITTSRLVEKNAVGDVIEAMKFLPENAKFLILGTGPLEKNLRQTTDRLQLGERVKFLGFIPHQELPAYLHISDIFIRPSLSEGMGNSFIEAMAAGVPVIATLVGGIPDFLKDKETGLFCAVHDPKGIARKVTVLLRDQEIRSYIIQNAQKLVSEKYDWNLVASKMKTILLVN